jgi:hypothetical protein
VSRKIPACDLKKGHRLVKRNSAGQIRWLDPVHHVERPADCGVRGTHVNYGEFCFHPLAIVEVR